MQKQLDVKEFKESGYLQELNRRFLHPLGLALDVMTTDKGEMKFGPVWDCRDDPEGVIFSNIDATQASSIQEQWDQRAKTRADKLGYIIQPLGKK